jgi:alpha,alpha-trehalase
MTVTADAAAGFEPVRGTDGYLPLEDHGLIGDGTTAALVSRDGVISWLCLPRFDAPPVFCSLLDHRRGGHFRITPEDLEESRQYYEGDSGVLTTEMRSGTGTVRVTDCLLLREGSNLSEDMSAGRSELLRTVRVIDGSVRLKIEVRPRGKVSVERRAGGLMIAMHDRPDLDLQLSSSPAVEGLERTVELQQGDHLQMMLKWEGAAHRHSHVDMDQLLKGTQRAWESWIGCFDYQGPQRTMVKRSAITLKLLDYFASGSLLAAPTSSLPEAIGGERNWDYRFAWVRDAAFSVYALRRVGLEAEAWAFLGWVLDVVAARDGDPGVLFTVDGDDPPDEWVDEGLEGYRRSAPVRWGNGAAGQRQHDAFGEIVDCAYQWAAGGAPLDDVWPALTNLIESARTLWREPDHGIWEVRTSGAVFTYSAAMCQVALDRGALLVENRGLSGDAKAWRAEADRIRKAILEEAWDEDRQSITEHVGEGGALDASLLALPLRRVIDVRHPKMISTVEAITRELGVGEGLLHRYDPEQSPDGLEGGEGAFLLCSFWLVDNLAGQGRLDEAGALYESLCGRANPLGLLPEQIDPSTGAFLGNYPQAFSHVGVVSSGINLHRKSR